MKVGDHVRGDHVAQHVVGDVAQGAELGHVMSEI